MKILLLGANGQLGWQLRRSLGVLGEVTALARGSSLARGWSGDITDAPGLVRTVSGLQPDVIVNAAAYTAVDRAENEPAAAYAANAYACETLAREAQLIGAWLVHYSTEYVFDGSGKHPWCETDAPSPLNVYGRSKLAGEKAVTHLCERHLILRCSWLFDAPGRNFLSAILRAALDRETLDVVDDQWGAPTRAALVADVTAHLLKNRQPELAGIYHVAPSGEASRHAYAAFALKCALERGMPLKAGPADLRRISTPAASSGARRPANSRLDTACLRKTFGLALPGWQAGVEAVVAELAAATQSLRQTP